MKPDDARQPTIATVEHAPAAGAADATRTAARSRRIATIGVVALLLVAFAVQAWLAVRTKSPTIDEPLHAVAGYIYRYRHDFHVDPDHPILWKLWSSIPNGRDSINVPADSPMWSQEPSEIVRKYQWCSTLLYTPGTDADRFIARARAMMLIVAVFLGLLIALWAGRIAGAAAAIAATVLFALDPNFLGHGPLVKNDVAISMAMLGMAMAVWLVGQRASWIRLLLAAVMLSIGLTVKFTGVLMVPMLILLLLLRALLPSSWNVLGRSLITRSRRVIAATLICLAIGLFSFGWIWACYQFRFAPSPDGRTPMDMAALADYARRIEQHVRNPAKYGDFGPTDADMVGVKPSAKIKFVMWLDAHRLFPQSWLAGLLYTYGTTLSRHTYLLGMHSTVGWWYYFPLAILFKTPVATLLAGLGAVIVAVLAFAQSRSAAATPTRAAGPAAAAAHKPSPPGALDPRYWTAACLGIPVLLYSTAAFSSNLNLGLRHMFPVYPFLFILIGVAFAYAYARWDRAAMLSGAVLAAVLAAESLSAFPGYIAFFNVGARAYRDPLDLLTDSNIDWGQDLKLLAAWQHQADHRHIPLYLVYFGTARPSYYDIDYINMLESMAPGAPIERPDRPGVIAVSARYLQGMYINPVLNPYMVLRDYRPIQILGDSIYLYQWPLRRSAPRQ